MANFPILFTNLPDGPIGVKSEAWIETQLDGVDWEPGANYALLTCQLNGVPTLGSYFELKFNGVVLRYTFISPTIFNKQIVKTAYGYNIAVVHTLGSSESCQESLYSSFLATHILTKYYKVFNGNIVARQPGVRWQFDIDHTNTSPFIGEYFIESNPVAETIPSNLMVALKIGLDPNKTDAIGECLPTVFSRPQFNSDGYYAFYHRIDEISLPYLSFQLPEATGGLTIASPLVGTIESMHRIARIQAFQTSGNPAVIQQGYFSDPDKIIVRSGISEETAKALGPNWFTDYLIDIRGGVMSYFDSKVVDGWQKFLYLASNREGELIRLYARPRIINSEGLEVEYSNLNIQGYTQEEPFEILCFQIGSNLANRVKSSLNYFLGASNYTLLGFTVFLSQGDVSNVFADLGYFEVVPEIYGSHCIYYENDFGGLSDCILLGGLSEFREIEKSEYQEIGFNNKITKPQLYQVITSNKTYYEGNSGAVDLKRLRELLEVLHSENVWIKSESGELIPISIDKSKSTVAKDDFSGEYPYALNIKFSRAYNRKSTAGQDIFSV
jgi:hypothetical protein